jgi:hypothetical protein
MRTTQRDQTGFSTFSAVVNDAPSGAGVAQPGNVPFVFTRAAAGQYEYRFDTALLPVSVTATEDTLTTNGVGVTALAPGTFRVITYAPPGTPVNGRHHWTCTARKTA